MRKHVLGAALAACMATVAVDASAQDKRPEYGTAVNVEAAKKIAAGVIAECRKNGWNVAVAVVDNQGFLVYFERMDNTQTASMDIAVGKAKSVRPIGVRPAPSWTPSIRAARRPPPSRPSLPLRADCRSWSVAMSPAGSGTAASPAIKTSNAPRPASARPSHSGKGALPAAVAAGPASMQRAAAQAGGP